MPWSGLKIVLKICSCFVHEFRANLKSQSLILATEVTYPSVELRKNVYILEKIVRNNDNGTKFVH